MIAVGVEEGIHRGDMAAPNKYRPQVLLGSDSHVMAWNPALSIYRVNRYQKQFSLDEKLERWKYEESKLDFIEELLLRNLDHCAEQILSYLDFQDQLGCLLVSRLWNEYIGGPVFHRKIEGLIGKEAGLQELAEQEGWGRQTTEEAELEVNKKLLAKVFLLKDIWRTREPKARRLFCDSFVLSLRADEETVFCGLNNGCVQAWDAVSMIKQREEECHEKGVKCIDMNSKVFLTGSYDTTFKVWERSSWTPLKTFNVHNDSVWDLRLHGTTVATAGLDGAVILYDFKTEFDLVVRCYIQADGDLVSAVDFSTQYLVTGHEDSYVGVWQLPEGTRMHTLTGHNGGVTGISLQGNLAATSSYDSMVRLWDVLAGTCLLTFTDPENFVRCVALQGQRIVSGDFGGEVHMWDLRSKDGKFEVANHRKWECHKGHIVCIQLSASRIVSGSRDKTLMVSDFWLKTVDSLGPKESESGRMRHSRFLKRDILSL